MWRASASLSRRPYHQRSDRWRPWCRGRKSKAYTANGFQSSFFKFIRKLTKEKKVKPGLTFHGLRHFVATKLADEGADAKTIASVLGQKTVQMAEHYSEGARGGRDLEPDAQPRTEGERRVKVSR